MKRIAKARDWSKKDGKITLQPALRRYQRYLEDRMLAASTIESYMIRVKLFLELAKTDTSTTNQFESYREVLRKKNKLSSYNNCCWAIKHCYAMNGQEVSFDFVKPKNTIPFWFDETDIVKIFPVIDNIKHHTSFQIVFLLVIGQVKYAI